jgi:membrane protein
VTGAASPLARARALARRAPGFLRHDLWEFEPEPRTLEARALWLLRFGAIVAQGFVRDQLLLRASALAYFTAVSLLPLLAVIVAIGAAFGVEGDFASIAVARLTAVLTDQVAGITSPDAFRDQLLGYVRGANFRGLGTLGAVALFALTVLALGNIERALNQIWGVREPRRLSRRFSDYLAVLVVAPLLLGTALSLVATLENQALVRWALQFSWFRVLHENGLALVPTLILAAGFAFVNGFLPNTRVRIGAALIAGIATAVAIEAAQGIFLRLGIGVARSNALFGSFAALPVLFAWIYVFWAIVLFGAELAFAYQNLRQYREEVRGREPSAAERESIALALLLEIARAFRAGRGALRDQALAESLAVPVRAARSVLAELSRAGLIAPRGGTGEPAGDYLLARPAEAIAVADVLRALRGERSAERDARNPRIAGVLAALEPDPRRTPAAHSLADLLAEERP